MIELIVSASIFGADVGSAEIVVACADERKPVKSIANRRPAIEAWLQQLPSDAVIGMEATGRYHEILAACAVQRGHRVYVINPKRLSAYAKGVGQRGKTDSQDAAVIARYVAREGGKLHPYTVPTATQQAIRDLLSQRVNVVTHCGAIRQCLKATAGLSNGQLQRAHQAALQSLQALIVAIDAQLKAVMAADAALDQRRARLQTIVGVGQLNSVALAHRFDRTPFANSDAVIAAYGLDPRPKDSGQKTGRRQLTKQGNAEDRRLIYLAAQSAVKTTTFKPLYQSLRAKGFATTEAIIIVARKILPIAFAIWNSDSTFNPDKLGFRGCQKP